MEKKYFKNSDRIKEKQASRDYDAFRLKNKLITEEELEKENALFYNFPFDQLVLYKVGNKVVNKIKE